MSSHDSPEQSVTAAFSELSEQDLAKRIKDTAYLFEYFSELATDYGDTLVSSFVLAAHLEGTDMDVQGDFELAKDTISTGRVKVSFEQPDTLISKAKEIMASAQENPTTVTASRIQKWDSVDHTLLYMIAKLRTAALEQEQAAKKASGGK